MNSWTTKSMELANQGDYLDQLYKVYPMTKNIKREPGQSIIDQLSVYLNNNSNEDNKNLLEYLFSKDIDKKFAFPIKDSYVAFLRRDKSAINRNPLTVDRLAGMIHELGINGVVTNMSKPIETNRQIGPLFKNWLKKGSLGIPVTDDEDLFFDSDDNMIFNSDDATMMRVAREHLGYHRNKGLDFLCKYKGSFLIGEAKFLTDFGGHQNDQLEDALSTLRTELAPTKYDVKTLAILDGVVFLKSKGKMQQMLKNASDEEVIISSLFLRDYLYSL